MPPTIGVCKKIFTYGNYVCYRPSIPISRSYRHRIPKNPQGGVRSLTYTLSSPLHQKVKNSPDLPKFPSLTPTVDPPLEYGTRKFLKLCKIVRRIQWCRQNSLKTSI